MNISEGLEIYASIAFVLFLMFNFTFRYITNKEPYCSNHNIAPYTLLSIITTPITTYDYLGRTTTEYR